MPERATASRLADAISPYLLQHAEDPVDWYPWGEEAFARARAEQRPIFLSIGYASCHWCHVMAQESFQNLDTARLLNEHFVSVKVDREERPDLDAIYLQAALHIAGHGGWPLAVFLTPDLKPFYAGTYFPPQDAENLPGFRTVLNQVAEAWRTRREELEEFADEVVARLQAEYRLPAREGIPTEGMLGRAYRSYTNRFDREHGGFGRAPKFPAAEAIRFLIRYHQRTGDEFAAHMAERTLQEMAAGGIHDQVGGGFHRYAVDRAWLVPHFEKMLYDNALLASAYLEAHSAFGRHEYGETARETLDFLLRDLTTPEGGFAAALDADTPQGEGYYYTWTPEEVAAALSPDEARAVMLRYGVSEGGNFEGRTVLHRETTVPEVAAELRIVPARAQALLARARERLLAVRNGRMVPARDDLVVTSWNGLAIEALALGYRYLDVHPYLEAARRTARLLLTEAMPGGELRHAYRASRSAVPGLLEDFAYLGRGLLELHRADPDGGWAEQAVRIMNQAEPLWDVGGGAYWEEAEAPDRILRRKEHEDGPTPAPNAVAVSNLTALSRLSGDITRFERAHQILATFHPQMEANPSGHAGLMLALDDVLQERKRREKEQ